MEAVPYEDRLRQDRRFARREADCFFGRPVYATVEAIGRKLDDVGIPYALIGSAAIGQYGLDRSYGEIDLLVTNAGLEKFRESCADFGCAPSGARTFYSATGVKIRFRVTGQFPGDGSPKAIAFPDPAVAAVDIAGLRVIALENLIELSLASGRLEDTADIPNLIRDAYLPEDLADRLDPSVREEYLTYWRAAQIKDPFDE